MALLQQSNAIFHHPLDDATESFKSDLWTGPSTFLSGKVGSGLGGKVIDALSPGSIAGLGTKVSNLAIDALDSTRVVVCYNNVNTSGHGTAQIGTVSGSTITWGAKSEFLSVTQATAISVTAVSPGRVVVVYRDTSILPDTGASNVGTVTGGTITWGPQALYQPGPGNGGVVSNALVALDSTRVVVCYRHNWLIKGSAKVGTISGTDISWGAEARFLESGVTQVAAVALNSSVFVVCWNDDTTPQGESKVGTVAGTDITFGPEAVYNSGAQVGNNSLVSLDSSTVVVGYRDFGNSSHGTVNVGFVSGTSVSWGPKSEFLGETVNNLSIAALNSTQVVVHYRDSTDANGLVKLGDVSGATTTFGLSVTFLTTLGTTDGAVGITAALVGNGTVVAYRNEDIGGDPGQGNVIVTLADSSLSGNTVLYDTTVGSSRLAFTAWMKNPSV